VRILAEEESIEEQGVRWDSDRWHEGIRRFPAGEWLIPRLDALAELSASDSKIRRRHLFALADGDTVNFYLAVMIWGFGEASYGWWRTGAIATAAGHERLALAVGELRKAASNGPGAAWDAWVNHEVAKLSGIGAAFASKLAHFAAFKRVSGRSPLIADANTALAVWALAGLWDSRVNRSKYCKYVDIAYQWADAEGCRPDEVERALFRLGPGVRQARKRSHGKD
jgi:hypothetical protein